MSEDLESSPPLGTKSGVAYIRRHETGDGISSRYFKQVMLISEVNGRISELRGKGYVIDTSVVEDRYGFKYHRLISVPGTS